MPFESLVNIAIPAFQVSAGHATGLIIIVLPFFCLLAYAIGGSLVPRPGRQAGRATLALMFFLWGIVFFCFFPSFLEFRLYFEADIYDYESSDLQMSVRTAYCLWGITGIWSALLVVYLSHKSVFCITLHTTGVFCLGIACFVCPVVFNGSFTLLSGSLIDCMLHMSTGTIVSFPVFAFANLRYYVLVRNNHRKGVAKKNEPEGEESN